MELQNLLLFFSFPVGGGIVGYRRHYYTEFLEDV